MATVQMDQALADEMVSQAIAYCAERKFNGDTQQTIAALCRGRCDICNILSNSLVEQVSEYLGRMDKMVKAVYRFEPQSWLLHPEPGLRQTANPKSGINLVAWVDRKSAALTALGTTLENVLT